MHSRSDIQSCENLARGLLSETIKRVSFYIRYMFLISNVRRCLKSSPQIEHNLAWFINEHEIVETTERMKIYIIESLE